MTKVLMISTDRNLFQNDTEVRERIIKYGRLAEELHIIVFSVRSSGLAPQKISDNVWVYPTNSINRWLYVCDAISLGKKIISTSHKLKTQSFLVTAQDPFETGLAGFRIARKFNLPLQLQIHTDFLDSRFAYGSYLNKIRRMIARRILPKATRIRVVSQNIKQAVLKAYSSVRPEVIDILPVFVDLRSIRDGEPAFDLKKKYPQFDTHLLLVARLEQEKNIPLAFSALKIVLGKHPKTGLIVVGEGSEHATLADLARREHIENNVAFEGWQKNLSPYYKTADVLLVTSNYEGFGRIFIEAAAAGCLIVTTDVGIARKLILDDERSFICPVGDPACMARNIIRLVEHENIRKVYALKLKGRAAGVTIGDEEAYFKEYGKLWERCVNKKP